MRAAAVIPATLLRGGSESRSIEPPREVVGLVGDVRETGLNDRDQGVMYVPEAQVTDPLTKLANNVIPLSWAIRASADPPASCRSASS